MAKAPKSIDEKRLELERSVHEHHVNYGSKVVWMVPVIGFLITFILGIWEPLHTLSEQSNLIQEEAEAELGNFEVRQLTEYQLNTPLEQQTEQFCDLFERGIFTTKVAQNKYAELTENNQKCYQLAKEKAQLEEESKRCEIQAVYITDSCRAYDKSGFNSKPKGRCGIKLQAGVDENGEPRFFHQKQVEVVSEYYRKIRGGFALTAIEPKNSAGKKFEEGDDYIALFSGSIGCTNDRGTGRTCEAKATVRAKSYPLSCRGKI